MVQEGAQQSHGSLERGAKLPGMFSRYKTSVEQELYSVVPGSDTSEAYQLVRYHLGWVDQQGSEMETPISQGKALRPTLCLFACEALADDFSKALPAAAAVELIHNFSLIHDDIQDQDVERRHRPTVWHIWGIPRALAAGNAMQCAGDLALLGAGGRDVAPETVLRVSDILTESYLEMIQGQCLDLEFESRTDIKADEYLYMIACKTGALIRCALEIGAMMATKDAATVQAFSNFGDCLGQVFQIRDDYLGIWGDETVTGKPARNDIRRRKKSFPIIFALSKTSGQAHDNIMQIYRQQEFDDDDVYQVLAVLDEVGAQEESQSLVEESAQDALNALAPVSLPSWARNEAEALVDFLSKRQY